MRKGLKHRICSKCSVRKPFTGEYFYRTRDTNSGFKTICKDCIRKYQHSEHGREINRKAVAKYYQKNLIQRRIICREYRFRKLYGLSLEDRMMMYQRQKGCCEMCGVKCDISEMTIDHNHITDEVRALLCRRCNFGLGIIEDRKFCQNAERYLAKWKGGIQVA